MSRPRYQDLLPDQIDALIWKGVLNGCGPKTKWLEWIIPEFDFKPCCFEHDFEWWIGGTHKDRRKSNIQFYRCMRTRVKTSTKYGWFKKQLFMSLTHVYYVPVATWTFISGPFKFAFHYGEPRDWNDINEVLNEWKGRS